MRVVEDAHDAARCEIDHVGAEGNDAGVFTLCGEALRGEPTTFELVAAVHAAVIGDRRTDPAHGCEQHRAGLVVKALELILDAAF